MVLVKGMAQPFPASQSRKHAPAVGSPTGPTEPGDTSVTPFGPVADIPGRPHIRLHRSRDPLEIAETLGDKEMAAAIRDRLGKRIDVELGRSPLIEDLKALAFGAMAALVLIWAIMVVVKQGA